MAVRSKSVLPASEKVLSTLGGTVLSPAARTLLTFRPDTMGNTVTTKFTTRITKNNYMNKLPCLRPYLKWTSPTGLILIT